MTCIVSPAVFTSKAALRIAAEQGVLWITDPSIVAPRYDLAVGQSEVVTNHPARTKFARIERTATGWKVT